MLQDAVRWAGAVVGLVAVVATAVNLVQTLVVPRGRVRGLPHRVSALVRAVFQLWADRARSYEAKDRILASAGPVSLLVLLLTWLLLFQVGYALVLWPLAGGSFPAAMREIGSSLFTLGFAARDRPAATFIDLAAAITGLLTVALQIAYLPVLYGAFSRREVLVTMLVSRAGSPAWGPEILARHHLVGIMDNLRHFYADWETWAAEVAESHTNYPTLISFRSPHHLRSWALALLAVLDSAALYHALHGDEAPSETRLCLRQGFTTLRDLARVLAIPYDDDPDPDADLALTYGEYLVGISRLQQVDFPMPRTPEEAWPHFRGWRNNYESIAYALNDAVVAPPAAWSGPRSRLRGVELVPVRPVDRKPGGEVRHFDPPPMPRD